MMSLYILTLDSTSTVITIRILFLNHFSFDETYLSPFQYFLSLGTFLLVFLNWCFRCHWCVVKLDLRLWLPLASFISLALNFFLFRQQYNVGLYLFFGWMDFMYIMHVFAFWYARQWTQGPANTNRELQPNSKLYHHYQQFPWSWVQKCKLAT